MEVADSESDKQPGNSRPGSFSILGWLKKIFSLNKKIDLTSEEREKQIEESIERLGDKSGFPMGVALFQPLKYGTLCALVQSSLEVLDIRSISPRALK